LKEIRHDSEDLDYDQREALGLKKYNPEEPRDRGGRWTRDGNYHRLSPELYAKVKRRSSGPGGAVELSSNEVKEILEKGVFALISGGPSPHDPPSMTAEQVEQRHKSLVADLTEAGYMHTDATGFYNGKENSMLVMTHDADREEMFALGQKYNQDSVIYANNGSNQMLFTRGPNEGKMHVGDGYDDAKDFLDFYTQIETSDKKTEKFSLHFDFANFKTKGSNRFREDLHPRAQGGRFGVKPDKDDGKPYDSVAVPEGRIPIREMVQHYQDLRKRDPRQAAKLRDKIKEIIHKYNLDPEKVWGEDPDDPKKRKPSDKTKIDDIDDSDFDEDELEFTAGNTEKRKALRELKDHLKSWKGKPARPKKDNTEMQYTVEDFDSKGMSRKYTPERSELHNKIIDFFFAGVKPVDSPVAHMMGGGPASGKSSVIKSGDVKTDSNSVAIDPDMIKKYLPEYLPGVAKRDDGIASFVHEESSWLGKVLTDKAASGNFNLLIDGTGNTSFESVKSKVEALRKKGFTPDRIRATYVTVDIEEAFKRNDERFAKTGRKVPTSFVEECHAHVSDIVPKLMQDGTFSELELYDTNNGKVPVKVASYVNGKMEILNLSLWDRFLRKSEFLQSQKYKDILAAREAADKPKKKKKSAEAPHESDLATDVRNHLLGRESALPDFLLEELAEKNQGWYVPSEWTV
jgi:predicted ABC-type ATPase